MGARLDTTLPGHDVDLFDNYCEHHLVRDQVTREVVGTYRFLTPAQARRVGSTYSDIEFDLTRLRSLREHMVELGRSCVHPNYRHGGVIMALAFAGRPVLIAGTAFKAARNAIFGEGLLIRNTSDFSIH